MQRLKQPLSSAANHRPKPKRIDHISLQNTPEQQFEELGIVLKKARLAQGISLNAAALATYIRSDTLEAIEEGRLEQLPEPVYLRGILKKYTNFLKLETQATFHELYPAKQNNSSKASKLLNKIPAIQIKPIHLYLFYLLLIIFSVQKIADSLEHSRTLINNQNINQTKNSPISPEVQSKIKK
jgi:cytoskeletal protein RodZ